MVLAAKIAGEVTVGIEIEGKLMVDETVEYIAVERVVAAIVGRVGIEAKHYARLYQELHQKKVDVEGH